MKSRQTAVSIVGASRSGDVTTIELRLDEGSWPTVPLAPATIWGGDDGQARVTDVHRLVVLRDGAATFENYVRDETVPALGGSHRFIAWWTPDQLEAASDTALAWARHAYAGRDHDHCLLTWEMISPGATAYASERGWITVEAYERFIRDDVVRLRGPDKDRGS